MTLTNQNTTSFNSNFRNKAFSLVELLIVISIIGILAAIAVPNISKLNKSAEEAKDRRNAQQIASVVSAAMAAGAWKTGEALGQFSNNNPDEDNYGGLVDGKQAEVIAQIVAGVKINDADSVFQGANFSVPNLSTQQQTAAGQYLVISNGELVYQQNKGNTGNTGATDATNQ